MATSSQNRPALRFNGFEVDPRSRELRKNGSRVRLQDQPLEVLLLLVERKGEVVTREELKEKLWPAGTFVDSDDGLNTAIKKLRDVLHDSIGRPRYIETIPRRGYRFIGKVDGEEAEAPQQTFEPLRGLLPVTNAGSTANTATTSSETLLESTGATAIAGVPATKTRWRRLAVFILAVLVVLAILAIASKRPSVGKAVMPEVHAIAVLPLTNLSGDSSQDYLTDGVTDELITDLARSTSIPVISRTSVMRYKERQKSLPVIARELGVDAVVEGTLKHTGNRLRITVDLIASDSDTHVWAKGYDGDITEIPQMETQAAADIAATMRAPASTRPETGPPPNISAEAYEEYQKGQFLWRQWQIGAALRHFQRAVELEPNYAAAYAGIGKSYCRMDSGQIMPSAEAFPPASLAIEKALALDPSNAEAHAARSFLLAQRDWNWDGAEAEEKSAIALDPSNAFIHRWYSWILARKGRPDDALEQARQAARLDPAFAGSVATYAQRLAEVGRNDEAIQRFLDAAELQPDDAGIRFGLAAAYEKKGKFDLEGQQLGKAYDLAGEQTIANQLRRDWHPGNYTNAAVAASRSHFLKQLRELQTKSAAHRYASPSDYVYTYAGLHDREETLRWLEEAYRADAYVMVQLRDPMFDFVRQDPRFQEIYQRVPFSH